MKRFEKFLNRDSEQHFLFEDARITSLGIEKRYVPEEIDIFDELEFGLGTWKKNQLVFVVVLEHGKLGRISLGYIPPEGDDDDMMAFTPAQLDLVLSEHYQRIQAFLEGLFPEPVVE